MRLVKKDWNAIGTAVAILIVAMIIATMAIAVLYMLPPADDNGNGGQNGDENDVDESFYILITGKDGKVTNMSLAQMKELGNASGSAKAQNRFGNWGGEGVYEGIKISSIITSIPGGMSPGDVLRITSEDGYYQDFTYYNVYPDDDWHQLQGDFILAYSFNDTEAPEWDEGLKLISLPPDGGYSQQDCNWTSAVGQGYNINPSAGARWVRNVAFIEITAREPDWSVKLEGKTTKQMSGTEFFMFVQWHPAHFVDHDEKNWSGVPLWRILALVDGEASRGEGANNDTWADIGYNVTIRAAEGYNRTFTSHQISGNDSLLLAFQLDGQRLGESMAPLKIVGPGLATSQMVHNIVEIVVDE